MAFGQDQLAPGRGRVRACSRSTDSAVVEHRPAERDDLAAEDVVLEGEVAELGGGAGGDVGGGRDHLHRDAVHVALAVRAAVEQDDPFVAAGGQQHRRAQAHDGLAVRSGLAAHRGDVARHRAVVEVVLAGGDQVAETEGAAVPVVGHADHLDAAPGLGAPGVEGGLHVGVLVGRPPLLDEGELRGVDAEVRPDDPGEGRALVGAGGGHEAAQHPAAVAPQVRQLGSRVPARGSARRGARRAAGLREAHRESPCVPVHDRHSRAGSRARGGVPTGQ